MVRQQSKGAWAERSTPSRKYETPAPPEACRLHESALRRTSGEGGIGTKHDALRVVLTNPRRAVVRDLRQAVHGYVGRSEVAQVAARVVPQVWRHANPHVPPVAEAPVLKNETRKRAPLRTMLSLVRR